MSLAQMFRRIEIKRALKILPQYFIGTLLLSFVIALLALGGTMLGKKNEEKVAVQIALVLNDNVELSTLGMQVLENAQSTDGLAQFSTVTEEEAMTGLANGTFSGAVIFPDQFVDDVNSSEKAEAHVYFPQFGNSFNDSILKGLVDAGGVLLTATEVGVENVRNYCYKYEVDKEIRWELVDEASMLIAEYSMSREETFVKDTASGTGTVNMVQYYFCAAIVLLLLLGGISCGPLLKGDTKAYQNQLIHHRIGPVQQLLTKYMAVVALFAVLYTAIFACLGCGRLFAAKPVEKFFEIGSAKELMVWFISGLPILLLAAAIVVFVYAFSANQIGGILLLFLVSLLMGYASGCLAPSAFLPSKLREIGDDLPTAVMFTMLRNGVRQVWEWNVLWLLTVHTAFWLGLACIVTKAKVWWDAR